MNETPLKLNGKNVTIVGLSRTAIALAKLLVAKGAKPFITETRNEDELGDLPETLHAEGIPYESGGHTPGAFGVYHGRHSV